MEIKKWSGQLERLPAPEVETSLYFHHLSSKSCHTFSYQNTDNLLHLLPHSLSHIDYKSNTLVKCGILGYLRNKNSTKDILQINFR